MTTANGQAEPAFDVVLRPTDDPSGYSAWLESTSVSTPHSEEMVLAWKLARSIGESPTNVIRALRGQRGQKPALIDTLEQIVLRNPSLRFSADGRVRRVSCSPQGAVPGER